MKKSFRVLIIGAVSAMAMAVSTVAVAGGHEVYVVAPAAEQAEAAEQQHADAVAYNVVNLRALSLQDVGLAIETSTGGSVTAERHTFATLPAVASKQTEYRTPFFEVGWRS